MVLWRISNHANLEGLGGLYAPARWHYPGRPIVYLASTPAGALLEILVHLEIADGLFPPDFRLLKVQAPDAVSRRAIEESAMPKDWSQDARISRRMGSAWLQTSTSCLLSAPSAIVPETANWLLNPLHPDSRHVTIEWDRRFPYDGRLFRRRLKTPRPIRP